MEYRRGPELVSKAFELCVVSKYRGYEAKLPVNATQKKKK